ncbi:MAG: hypothetical protein Q9216_001612 [Gyalolechia sp. 2 TL-2023]
MSGQNFLCALPREIRDEIYASVLSVPAAPPVSPADAGVRYMEKVKWRSRDRNIFYPLPSTCSGPTPALSHCNRLLRQELYELITNHRITRSATYELDVMLQGCRLWPTWTKLPYPAANMEHLEVNLRIFDVRRGGGLFWGCGGPGLAFVVLFRALDRLLHHGPRFLYKKGAIQSLDIDTLTINVLHGYGTVARPTDKGFKDREDPELRCTRLVEHNQEKIYQNICTHLYSVVRAGLLSGKVQTLNIRDGDKVESYTTNGVTPNFMPCERWKRYGFVWGVDEKMEAEKVESRDLHHRKEKKVEAEK